MRISCINKETVPHGVNRLDIFVGKIAVLGAGVAQHAAVGEDHARLLRAHKNLGCADHHPDGKNIGQNQNHNLIGIDTSCHERNDCDGDKDGETEQTGKISDQFDFLAAFELLFQLLNLFLLSFRHMIYPVAFCKLEIQVLIELL